MATIADLNVVIGASIDDFEAKMGRVQSGLGGLSNFAKNAGESLSTFVTLPLSLLAGASIAALAKIDGLTRGLNAVSTIDLGKQGVTGLDAVAGAAAATSERLKLLQEIARAPGIGFEQAVQGDIRLRAVGIAAGESAAILKEFANAIALTGGGASKLDEVTVQLAQLSAKGKVLAQDLRPVIEAAPAVATALQKLYGTVDSETISKSLEKQGKSSKDFIAILTDELGKLPRVTGGIGNSLDNFAQGATQSLAKLGDALNKAFNVDANVNRLADFITRLTDSFAALDPGVQKAIFVLAGIAAATGPVLVAIGTLGLALPALAVGFGVLGTAATATWVAVTGPVGLVVLGIAAVAAGAAVLIDRFGSVEKVAAAFGAAVTNLASQALTALSTGLALTGLPLFASLAAEAAAKVGELAARLGLLSAPAKALSGSFDDAFRNLGGGFDGLSGAVGDFNKTATVLTEAQTKALEKQLKAVQDLDKGYENIGRRTTEGLRPKDAPEFIATPKSGLAGLPTTLQTLPGFDTTALAASAEAARLAYEKMTDAQKATYKSTLEFNTGFGAAMEQLSSSIGPLLADIAGQVGNAFASIVVGTASAGDALATLFGGILQSIGGFMTQFGKQLVVLGIGKVGLDNLFKGAAGGPLAIAAGLGLIALGSLASAVGSSAASSVSSISSGGGGSSIASAPRSSFTPTTAPNIAAPGNAIRNIHNVVFELSGNKLVAAIDLETDRLGRVIGASRR